MAATQDTLAPPQTPERGRSRTRYPLHLTRDLDPEGNPRPPLHRRGTSRTYETLEDLLTQAGYKETRIFTPEVDRRDPARDEEHHKENVPKEESRGGVSGAVVKLLTTWMSTASRRAGARRGAGEDADEADGDDGDVHDVPPPSPLAHRATTRRKQSPPPPSTRNPPILQQQQQHSHPRPPLGASAAPNLHQPSRAHMALRHVASAPQIDKRRQAAAGRTQSGRTSSRPNKAKARPPPPPPLPPPLPTNWFESISAALLLHTSPPSPVSSHLPAVVVNRRGRLPSSMLATSGRAHASPGTITITNVVCRSAPASRSPSVVRNQTRRPPLRPPLPVLAQTAVFADDADCPAHSPLALPAAAQQADEDEDEEQELNLAMMLIPAKRQHSIRSLRSLLVQHSAHTTHSASASLSREYARMMRRRIEQADAEDAAAAASASADGGHWDSGEFLTARIKHRRSGLPNNWGWSS